VRGLRAAHDIIDPDRLETALVELGEARLKKPADGLAALGAQLALLGGNAAAQ